MAALVSPPESVNMSEASPTVSRDARPSAFTAINGTYSSRPSTEGHMGDTITVQANKQSYERSQSSDRPTPPPSRQENVHDDYRSANFSTSDHGHHQLPSPTDTLLHGTKRKRDESPSTSPRVQHPREAHSAVDHSENSDDYRYRRQATEMRDTNTDGNSNFDDRSNSDTANTSRNSPSDPRQEPYPSMRDSYPPFSPNESRHPTVAIPEIKGRPHWVRPTSYPAMYTHDPPQAHSQHQILNSPHQDGAHHDHNANEWGLQSANHETANKDGGYPEGLHTQLGPKRKRNFSNRTKTGCITCRRRKKKCDEGHPFCQNCMRGGFKCDGYTGRTPWPKPNNSKAPVPLQSKEGFPSEAENRYPGEGYPHQQSHHSGSLVNHHGQQSQRPVTSERIESTGGKYMTSPAPSSAQQPLPPAWPSATPSLHRSEKGPRADFRDLPQLQHPDSMRRTKEYRSVLSVNELSGAPPESGHPGSGVSWPSESPSDGRSNYAPPSALAPPSAMPPPLTAPPSSVESRYGDKAAVDRQDQIDRLANASEKEKMLGMRIFKFMDPELREERSRCKENLWRLNNAENPAFGIPESERQRLLKQVLQPSKDGSTISPISPDGPSGSLGPNARVELPFTCHYGYNIQIGEDVYIGENCTIIDACSVKIGARVWIGSNVQILTAMAHTDIQYRQGANSSWQGKEVIIEEDVYIGAGAILYPGVKLARGAFVEPGSTIKGNMLEYSYMGYKPAFLY